MKLLCCVVVLCVAVFANAGPVVEDDISTAHIDNSVRILFLRLKLLVELYIFREVATKEVWYKFF